MSAHRNQMAWERHWRSVAAGLVVLMAGSVCSRGDEESLQSTHAERLIWQQESWISIELETTSNSKLGADWSGPPLDFDRSVWHYIETVVGQQLLDMRSFKDNEIEYRSAHYFDGKIGAGVVFARDDPDQEQQVIIQRHFDGHRPKPLFFYNVGREPLQEVLRDARLQGESQVIGRGCDVFLLSSVGLTGNQDHVYYLDKVTSVPLRVEIYLNAQDREEDRPYLVWTAKKLDQVQGYPIVRESVQEKYKGEDGKLSVTSEYRVESVAFNKDFPKSTFQPKLEPGAVVFDTIADKPAYEVPGAAKAADDANLTKTTAPADPIRAEPPLGWSTYAAPTSIGLGIAILTTSLVLLWRRA